MRSHKSFQTAFMVIVLLALFQPAWADVPHAINYQGRLTDDTGQPVPDDIYSVKFTIYSDSTSTDPSEVLWTSGFWKVTTTNGLFSYMLGSNTPLDDYFFRERSNIFLGITLSGYSEMSPRQRLTSSSYAFHALRADTAAAISGEDYLKADGDTLEDDLYFGIDAGRILVGDHSANLDLRESGNVTAYLWGQTYGTLELHDVDYNTTAVLDASYNSGGRLQLTDETGSLKINMDGGNDGDGSVVLPDDAINSDEILDEPAIAYNMDPAAIVYLENGDLETIVSISVTVPAPGYVYIAADCIMDIEDSVRPRAGVYLQLDAFDYGGIDFGEDYWKHYSEISETFIMSAQLDRVFFVDSAGTYSFRLKGESYWLTSVIAAQNADITAMYFPSSCGSVKAMTDDPGDDPDAELVTITKPDGTTETKYKVDLRYYELRAKEARLRAQEAELELIKARERSASE